MLFYSFYNIFGKRNWLRKILKVSICMLTFNHQPCDHEMISLVFGIHRQAFTLQNLEIFNTSQKLKLGKLQDKSRLKEFSDVMGLRMILSCIKILKIIWVLTFSENWSQDTKSCKQFCIIHKCTLKSLVEKVKKNLALQKNLEKIST